MMLNANNLYIMCHKCYMVCHKCYMVCQKCYMMCHKCYMMCHTCYMMCHKCYMMCHTCYMMCHTCYVMCHKCYMMCHKCSHDMRFEASTGVIMSVEFANIGFMHVRLLTLLCFWICRGYYCLVVFLFGFPLCSFYSLCPLWLLYFKTQ
jgi:hypothetical protein